MGNLVELARKLRPYIEKAVQSLDDNEALEVINLFPTWNENAAYFVEDKVRYEGVLYRCLQNHNAQSDWTPSTAPSLWAKVLVSENGEILDWEQPDSTNPYQIGDKVKHNGVIWENTIANNVWEPGIFGWIKV